MAWSNCARASWQVFRRLALAERGWLLQALLLLPLTALALRWVGLRRWQSTLAALAPLEEGRASPEEFVVQQAHRIARMVRAAASRGLFGPNCLHHSVALWWLLRRQGISSELRIGTRKRVNCLEAHAWVELYGQALNAPDDVHLHFRPFGRAIAPAEAKLQ